MNDIIEICGGIAVAIMTDKTVLEKKLESALVKFRQRRAEISADAELRKSAPRCVKLPKFPPGVHVSERAKQLLVDIQLMRDDRRAKDEAEIAALKAYNEDIAEARRVGLPELVKWATPNIGGGVYHVVEKTFDSRPRDGNDDGMAEAVRAKSIKKLELPRTNDIPTASLSEVVLNRRPDSTKGNRL